MTTSAFTPRKRRVDAETAPPTAQQRQAVTNAITLLGETVSSPSFPEHVLRRVCRTNRSSSSQANHIRRPNCPSSNTNQSTQPNPTSQTNQTHQVNDNNNRDKRMILLLRWSSIRGLEDAVAKLNRSTNNHVMIDDSVVERFMKQVNVMVGITETHFVDKALTTLTTSTSGLGIDQTAVDTFRRSEGGILCWNEVKYNEHDDYIRASFVVKPCPGDKSIRDLFAESIPGGSASFDALRDFVLEEPESADDGIPASDMAQKILPELERTGCRVCHVSCGKLCSKCGVAKYCSVEH